MLEHKYRNRWREEADSWGREAAYRGVRRAVKIRHLAESGNLRVNGNSARAHINSGAASINIGLVIKWHDFDTVRGSDRGGHLGGKMEAAVYYSILLLARV